MKIDIKKISFIFIRVSSFIELNECCLEKNKLKGNTNLFL